MSTKPTPAIGPKIHLALAAILKDIVAIEKDRENKQQGFRFRGIDDLYNHLHPVFAAHGVTCVPFVENVFLPEIFKNAKGNNVFRSVVTAGYIFTASDGSEHRAKAVGEGMDFADKATAKAMSAAHKYTLIQTFLIPTQDVADADYDSTINPHEELREIEEQRRRELEQQRQAQALEEKRLLAEEELRKQGGAPAGSTPAQPAEKPKTTRKKKEETLAPEPEPQPEEQPQAEEPEAEREWEGDGAAHGQNGWQSHVVSAIGHKDYFGKKLGDLSDSEIDKLSRNWAEKAEFQEGIDKDPKKSELRKYVRDAVKARLGK